MSVGPSTLEFFLRERKARPLAGRVLTLGRQDVQFTQAQLQQRWAEHGLAFPGDVPLELTWRADCRWQGVVSDGYLFKCLGCSEVQSLDRSLAEQASICWDLNRLDIPPGCERRFDVIFDGGTLEHVFNVPNALWAVARMLAPGGRVLHAAPADNYLGHGYYQLAPQLLADFYRANGFRIDVCWLHTVPVSEMHQHFGVFIEHNPDQGGHVPTHGNITDLFFAATLVEPYFKLITPMQR